MEGHQPGIPAGLGALGRLIGDHRTIRLRSACEPTPNDSDPGRPVAPPDHQRDRQQNEFDPQRRDCHLSRREKWLLALVGRRVGHRPQEESEFVVQLERERPDGVGRGVGEIAHREGGPDGVRVLGTADRRPDCQRERDRHQQRVRERASARHIERVVQRLVNQIGEHRREGEYERRQPRGRLAGRGSGVCGVEQVGDAGVDGREHHFIIYIIKTTIIIIYYIKVC